LRARPKTANVPRPDPLQPDLGIRDTGQQMI
jgi:hypothetical protein